MTAFLDACWPKTTPEEVLTELLADPGGADPGGGTDLGGANPGGGTDLGRTDPGGCTAPSSADPEGGTDPSGAGPAPRGVAGLTAAERDAIRWTRPPRSYRTARWSAADLVLLDELAGLIERPGSYGHVVVDEAQDLSPMQCRAVARRTAFGSLTVLGDLAQGTTPWAARDWRGQLAHLGKPEARVVP